MNAHLPKRRFTDLPRSQQAGIFSNDPTFQIYVARRLGLKTKHATASAAGEFIRMICGIESRRQLDSNRYPKAIDRFERLRTEFDAWRGKIARLH